MPEDIIWVGSGFFGLINTQCQHNDCAPFGQFGENGKIVVLDEAKHGVFSYYMMKGTEGDADSNKDRKITSGELHNYVLANVSRLQSNQTSEFEGDPERVLVNW